jgi:hypothetical protein
MPQRKVVKQVAIDGKVYPRGSHEFSEGAMKHPHFAHFVKAGYIQEASEKVVVEMTPEEKAKHDEMVAKFLPPRAVQVEVAAVDAGSSDEADVEVKAEVDEDPSEAPAKKQHPKKR